ncbi:MAG: hypothetical protein R2830_11975 [Saprospiraceae bacterium]
MLNLPMDFRGVWKTFIFLLFTLSATAQPKDNSPYSRIGLGKPVDHSLSAAGFGGLSAAYADPLHVNLLNPASYGTLNTAVFEAGLYAINSKLKFNDQSSNVWSGNLSHLALAFPLRNPLNDALAKKKRQIFWAMNIALLPNTSIGYNIETLVVDPQLDTTYNSFKGTGGTNKLLWGTGVRYKGFSAGLNLGYFFGQLENERQTRIGDVVGGFFDIYEDNISVRGFTYTLGAQYKIDLDKKAPDESVYNGRSLIFGAYGSSRTNFSTKSTKYRIAIPTNYSLTEIDTVSRQLGIKENGKLPAEFTLGVMYQKAAKWRLGLEYGFAAWKGYENEAKPEQLFNSHRIAAGAEIIPDFSSYNKYIQRIRYRVGFYYRTDPRLEDFNQYALTIGFGLPLVLPRQQTSFVNLSFELGQYNTKDAIKENFVKIALGFTLNDSSWFYKRKFG